MIPSKNHVDDLMLDGNKKNGKMIRIRPRQLLHGKLHTDERSSQDKNGKLLQLQHGQAYIH